MLKTDASTAASCFQRLRAIAARRAAWPGAVEASGGYGYAVGVTSILDWGQVF